MEGLDLNTNNLCTTEDAFEQFQSGAMYEEDEFITLSDIVSSPHTNQDVNEILHDDPCDEVVSLSIQDEKTINNINIPFEQNKIFDVNSQIKDKNNKDKARTSKRRGRKKKGSIENSDVPQTQCEIGLKKPTKPKRQSRKSIIALDTSELQYDEECVTEEPKGSVPVTDKVSKPANKAKRKSRNSLPGKEIEATVIKKQGKQAKQRTKKLQKESVNESEDKIISSAIADSNITTTTSICDNKKKKHKRGRKKQNIPCQDPVLNDTEVSAKLSEIESVIPTNKQNNELENSILTTPMHDEINKDSQVEHKPNLTRRKTSKKSVVTKSVKNDISEEDIEDLPLSNLSRKTENELLNNVDTTIRENTNVQCTTLENKNFTDSNINSKGNTLNCREITVKKRGRPKKISNNLHPKSDLEAKKFTTENIAKFDYINDLSQQEQQNKFDNSEKNSQPIVSPDNEPPENEQVPDSCEKINISTESLQESSQLKRNSKKKIIPDFEYNVDSVVKNDKTDDLPKSHEDDINLDAEDSSRRPVRRRVLKNWNYDEGSDEDPYANVELSDDEPRRRKKGGRCYSDDEYFPGDKRQMVESESDMAIDEDDLDLDNRPQKKKKGRKSDLVISNKSPRKKGRKSDAESICTTEKTNTNTDSGDVDFDDCLDSAVIRGNDDQVTPTKSKRDSQPWGKTNEFENFIAKIVQGTDIKISKKSVDNVKTSLQIPVIEATEVKKNVEKSAQTITVNTKSACVQTDTAYEIPMKDQVPLTGEQSEKACDFLSSIVQTTAELGQLMTQKSEDFIMKKINTKYVTDTFKMDYCVKKSFLLFKLAKHNLVQMEEDLSKQYEGFLRENNLIQHRQEQKIIASTSKATSDSDCEIVEEPVKKKVATKTEKPAFNPKTVFLNKELSIKIAKKPTEEPAPKKKIDIKGRHSVWINDSVLVKKVKPNQSFLAQDSRNKKPPDNKITLEKVNNFFKMYERQKALFMCAPFIKTEWFGKERKYMCNYFVDSTIDFPEKTVVMQNENVVSEVAFVEHDSNHIIGRSKPEESIGFCPDTLSLLCIKILQSFFHPKQLDGDNITKQYDFNQCKHVKTHSESVTNNVVEETHFLISDINKNIICLTPNYISSIYVQPLKTLCFKRVKELINSADYSDGKLNLTSDNVNVSLGVFYVNDTTNLKVKKNTSNHKLIKPLFSLCVKEIQETQKAHGPRNLNNVKYMPKSLKSITLDKVQIIISRHIVTNNTSLKEKCYYVKTPHRLCLDAPNIFTCGNSILNNTDSYKNCYNGKSLLQLCIDATNISLCGDGVTNNTGLELKCYSAETLLQKCIDVVNDSLYRNSITNSTSLKTKCYNVKSLLQFCLDTLNISSNGKSITNNTSLEQKCNNGTTLLQFCIDASNVSLYGKSVTNNTSLEQKYYNAKTLLQLCTNAPNISFYFNEASKIEDHPLLKHKNPEVYSVLTLKSICRNKITELSTEWYKRQCLLHEIKSEKTTLNFTINSVNTVSDDIFLDVASDNDLDNVDNDKYVEALYNEESQHYYSDVDCGTSYDDLGEDDNNWVSQVQMQELRSCLDSTRDIEIDDKISGVNENKDQDSIVRIKLEPNEYQPESVDSSNIKTEPGDDHEYMEESNNYSSINIITKQEEIVEAQVRIEPICQQSSNSYDEHFFESFVSSNKMIAALNDYGNKNDEIFSQSSQRVRRQYEPDSKDEMNVLTDTMNLLVPQNVECKDRLMESSEEEDDEEYKKSDKKKSEKRKCKSKNTKDLPNKGKILQKNEITVLTKKIKDKIRQAHDKSESSDSETDYLKSCIEDKKEKSTENKSNTYTKRKEEEKVIQCNDVDSTELITENKSNLAEQSNKKDEDPDEDNSESITNERSFSPLIDSNEPVEILECEPALPILDEFINKQSQEEKYINKNTLKDTCDTTLYVDRYSWKCYPIDRKDSKIYSDTYVQLEKLPESFLETYFKYQDIAEKTTDDIEVDKLTNLQSLQAAGSKNNNNLSKSNPTVPKEKTQVPDTSEVIESNEKELKKENFDEFSPSEDESTSNINKPVSPVPVQSSENHFAKNLLMNDESDTEKADEAIDAESTVIKIEKNIEQTYKTRSGRTVKCKVEQTEIEKDDIMLTADKMMNKELALLHAPVDLKQEEEDSKDFINKSHNKITQKNASKAQTTRCRIKSEDDSSSEEEKQWFTTKEKLLKRLLKKDENTNLDDAKRAKIVSEFIEKRGELPEPRQRARARRRCSKKTIMERRKQIKILSRELFGVETAYSKKYSQASTSKGRRNIRKVIDKKSLARSTVVANMEEFERKRRLTILQAQLREELGCEEGVNVVVINDELCLEYDFENKKPVVSVHQFFTKVMKAHQYEGVKFMWDACFESVYLTGGGSAGGGCILAHCMGLGKTLQVLALLHTVLTHPQVGMRRVLVCCPLSTVLNWVDEIHKWIGPVTNHIKVFELSKLKKTYERAYQLEDWYNGGGIFIIGYELFRSLSTLDPVLDCIRPTIVNKIRTALLDPGPDIIVCDEGHLLKNDCSVLAVAMSRVVTKRRIILTGTPMQNNLREYYCMVNFVKPNLLGSYSEYSNRFENPIMNGQHRDSREEDIKLMKARTHILHKVLEGCLQRQEASVLYPYLPKKYEYTVFISLTKCQWELYKHYLTHYINTKENKQSVLRDFHVLQKIWTHPLVLNNFLTKTRDDEKEPKIKAEKLDDDLEEAPEQAFPSAAAWWAGTDHRHVLHQLDSSYKFLVVFQLLHECVALGDKVLIFSTSLYAMDALEFFLNRENKWTLGREYYRLDGSVPPEVRQKWCREFNAPQNTNTKLFLISTRAGSLGLNMTAANRVIILDTSWNPAHDIQSIFRVYRFGQKKDCYIYRLVAMGTMEQKIYERSVTKQAVACRVVDEQQIDRHYNMAELSELYRLDEEGSGISAGLAAGVRDAALLRVAGAGEGGGGLHAVHEHDSLLRGSSETVLPEHERNAAWMQFQQEHATTHIRNFEINVPEQSVEDTKLTKIEPKEENETNTDDPTPKKVKKYKRKSKNKNIEPEPVPSTSQQDLSPDMEEIMIKKIMNILITHKFHTTKSPEEISALVKSVRDVVAKASKQSVDEVDPLTGSIARVLLESENITFPEVKTKQTDNNDEYKRVFVDDVDILEKDVRERKRRRNRRDSDEEYLPDARKRKPTAKTRKSNESVNSENNYDALDSGAESTDIISNREVLYEEPVVTSSKKSETLSEKPNESNHVTKIYEGTTKESNKKVKNVITYVKKEKHQSNNSYETVTHKSLNDSIQTNSIEEFSETGESLDIGLKKSALSTKPPKSKHVKTCKKSNKKIKTAKDLVQKEKQRSNSFETIENEPLIESTETISSEEVLEKESVFISSKESETLSEKQSECKQILNIHEKTSKQSNKKVKNANNNVNIETQQSNIYITLEKESLNETTETITSKELLEKEPVLKSLKTSETLSKKPSESNEIVKIDERSCNQSKKKITTAKKDVPKEKKSSNIYETIENDSSNECIEINDNGDTDNLSEEDPVKPTENESICLSDDDEPIITEPAPLNKKEINPVEKIKENDIIPLHKSVLTNKNFIKLVAHTYLSGNPMLDEDAAVLAAQYSTLKALKEVQATGKNLTSGPIHDIAVKVLGTHLMKRLFVANPNKHTAESLLLETENLQNKTMNDMLLENSKSQKPVLSEGSEKPEPESKSIHKRKLSTQRKANLANEDKQKASPSTTKSYQETTTPDATTRKVVPVGIVKGPVALSNQQLSLEECILPDDDEVIITTPPPPPPVGAQLARRNSKQLVVNIVSSKESNAREPQRSYVEELVPIASVSIPSRSTGHSTSNNIKPDKASLPSTIENASRNQNIIKVQNVNSDVKTVNINKNTPPASDVTICLDSDEEDIPSFVCAKNFNNPIISSDSRTLVVSPLVKNSGKNSSEINENKNIPVPVANVNTSSSPTPVDATKTRTASIEQRKNIIKEINTPKVIEKKCKPGDIIRINESGQVEILKRITAQSQLTKPKDDNRSEKNLKKVNPTAVTCPSSKDKLANVSDKANVFKEDKRKEIPSTSKQQKDTDPLSVIRNVVHIPALNYEKNMTPRSQVEKSIQTPLPSPKEVTVNTKLTNSKLEVKPVISFKNTHQIIINNDKQIKKQNIPSKSISSIKSNDVPKPQTDASKEVVIDLTRSQHVQIKKASVPAASNETNAAAGGSKDTGTTKVSSVVSDLKKNTILTIGKTVSKVSPKPSASSSAVPSTSDSKRSSPWSEAAQSKKLKTESKKKFTLSDFNLDDFDDIIELE